MSNDFPIPAFHFQVEWGGNKMGFAEVTGLDGGIQTRENMTGASPQFSMTNKPGLRKYQNIKLKRGLLPADSEFFQWLNTWQLNRVIKRDIIISLLDEKNKPTIVWKLKNAWAVKINTLHEKPDASEVAIECIEIDHEGLTVESR